MQVLGQIAAWLSAIANVIGKALLGPIAVVPGWLSATVVAALTGILLLLVFKYTSNQRAIKRVRNSINANMLALRLFKESTAVTLKAQGRILWGALRLFVLALVPMAIMTLPVMLVLGQLSLWYQHRPLRVGEDAVLSIKVDPAQVSDTTVVSLDPTNAVEVVAGPARVASKGEWAWNLKAKSPGEHRLRIKIGNESFEKLIAVNDGDELMRTSTLRPSWNWLDILLYPMEPPFPPGSQAQSISIDYPSRTSWTHGTDSWVIYWFVVSMISAICFLKVFKVSV